MPPQRSHSLVKAQTLGAKAVMVVKAADIGLNTAQALGHMENAAHAGATAELRINVRTRDALPTMPLG